ncbi:ESPR-type extended signal peptide-containing protein, partial [Histophilus somni]
MNKIFKTKYDVTTGQCKAVSELASNRQIASSSEKKPKCGANLKRTSLSENLLFNMLISGLVLFAYPAWATAAQTQVNKEGEIKIDADTLKSSSNSGGSNNNGKGKSDIIIGNDADVDNKSVASGNNGLGQRVALGNKAYVAGNQAVGIGGDVFAQGYSSIAIGSDDIGETADEKQKNGSGNDKYSKYAVPLPKAIWQLFVDEGDNFNSKTKNNYAVLQNGNSDGSNGKAKKSSEFYSNGNGSGKIDRNKDPAKWEEEYAKFNKDAYDKYVEGTQNGGSSNPKNVYSHTWAKGRGAIAIGARSIAYGDHSNAMGTLAIAKGNYSSAFGTGTIAFEEGGIAVGNNAYVYREHSIGVGNNVQAIQKGSMVFGVNSYAGGSGSLALGEYTFANVTMHDEFNGKAEAKKVTEFTKIMEDYKNKYNAENPDKSPLTFASYTPDSPDEKMNIEDLYTVPNYDTKTIQHVGKQFYRAKTNKQPGTGEEKAEQSKDSKGTYNQGGIAIGSYSVALGDNALTLGRHAYAKEDSTVAIGNFAFAKDENAFALGKAARSMGKDSLAIGVNSEIWSPDAVAIGTGSKVETNADGGVAIGQSATVAMGAGDSIAIGKNSKAGEKKQAFKTQEVNVGTKGLMFDWGSAGTSENDQEDKKKAVVSVGSAGSERIITNVAAGSVMNGSTDAINGGQLYSVIETFGKLGTDILGAEVYDKDKDKGQYGFKASTFDKVNYHREQPQGQGQQEQKAPTTFKQAIDETITAINKGMIFKAGNDNGGSGNTTTKQLGDTLEFKGDDKYIKASVDGSAIKYSVEVATSIDDSSTPSSSGGAGAGTTGSTDKLVTASAVKNYVTTKFGALSST